jgi:Trehalase
MAKSINMLRDLSRRSEEAISRLVTKDGKTKAGRNKAEPPGHISPKTSFAAFILEAWSFIRGVEPGPKNQKAAAAAELYWNVSTGHVSIEPTKAALKRIVDQEPKSWGEHSLNTIRTVSLLPVDLNNLMVHLEQTLAKAYQIKGDAGRSSRFAKPLTARRRFGVSCGTSDRECLPTPHGRSTPHWRRFTAAGLFPLFLHVGNPASSEDGGSDRPPRAAGARRRGHDVGGVGSARILTAIK